jgi:5-methylcytosine-specific restriction endonuclease McrA
MPLCKKCGKKAYSELCWQHKPRASIKTNKRPTQRGKEYYRYKAFRDDVAVPYLDKNFGHKCRYCGSTDGLQVDHIHNRGSHPQLKYQLSNLQWLCFICHRKKTDNMQ